MIKFNNFLNMTKCFKDLAKRSHTSKRLHPNASTNLFNDLIFKNIRYPVS